MPAPTDDELREILRGAKTIAVLGAHHEASRPAAYVPAYLADHGYDVRPVNPRCVGRTLFGSPVVATLSEVGGPVDVVDVFRTAAALPGHVPEILAMVPRPAVVWFQLGIVNDTVADALRAEGITVVQDRCTLAEHRRLGL